MNSRGPARTIEVYNAVGGAAFFQRLVEEWQASGATVVRHEAITDAAYRARRGPFGRLANRWQMYVGQAWICWRGAKRKDRLTIRVATTNPFFGPALVARAGGRQATTINLLYDLFPEALIEAGKIEPKSWAAQRCAAITRYALVHCSATVFLGDRLRRHTETKYGAARRAVVIPVGADGAPFREFRPIANGAVEPPQILYSGQMGRMHDIATLQQAWAAEKIPGLRWAFHATGAGYASLRRQTEKSSNMIWGDSLPGEVWQRTMLDSQVALVTISPGADRVVMPSKTYSAMVAGQALLAICRRHSDLADLVERHDCGWVVEPGDAPGLNRVLTEIATDRAGLLARRQRSFDAGHQFYDMTPVAKQWLQLFDELLPTV
jgi:glycosyltransferase involved in cell wall biosynthesis